MALILTIDDEPSIRQSFRNYLEDYDHEVLEAEDGKQGIDIWNHQQPDLILVDLNMPGISGLDVLQRVHSETPDLPVIVISGTGIIAEVVEALRLGAWNFLMKPIHDLEVLAHAVEDALEKSQLRQQHKRYQQQLEEEVALRSAELASLMNNLPIGLFRASFDSNGTVLMANPAMVAMFGYSSAKEIQQSTVAQFFANSNDIETFMERLSVEGSIIGQELLLQRADGTPFWGAVTTHLMLDASEQQNHYISGAVEDISLRKKAEQESEHLHMYDGLTNLPNRTMLLDRLDQQLSIAKQDQHFGSLLFLDIDNFKMLNDALGHVAGDKLLQESANRISKAVQSFDTVARLGSDEFVVLLTCINHSQEDAVYQAQTVAEHIRESIAQPFRIDGNDYNVTASIGICIYPGATNDSADFIRFADTAMYRAKKSGRNTIQFFQSQMQEASLKRLAMEKRLREALEQQRFRLHYQPLSAEDGTLLGAEVLLRMQTGNGTIVPPGDFIPVAEDSGLIIPIGMWVLQQACVDLLRWPELGYVSVNVSVRQFYQDDFVHQLQALIEECGLNPKRLTLEITEGMLLHNVKQAIAIMQSLRDLGIHFSIDDFGTGYSSLSYLKQLPIDVIKIDQSFVRDITEDVNDRAIVETIISMARHLGHGVVAEGVETTEQLQVLYQHGCRVFQGYLFSRPLAAEQFDTYYQTAKQGKGSSKPIPSFAITTNKEE